MVVKLVSPTTTNGDDKEEGAKTTTTTTSGSGRNLPTVLLVLWIMIVASFINISRAMGGRTLPSINEDSSGSYSAFFLPKSLNSNATKTATTNTTQQQQQQAQQQPHPPTTTANYDTRTITPTTRDQWMQEALHISRERLAQRVPQWVLEFFDWQQATLAKINADNWKSFRYLVLRCSRFDHSCGGMADRLKPLPLYLRLAKESKRIFLIRWERPYPIEEFLLPTPHFNWSVPSFINDILYKGKPFLFSQRELWKDSNRDFATDCQADSPVIVEMKKQMDDGGVSFYSDAYQEPFANVTLYQRYYHGIFRGMFQPHPNIELILKYQWDRTGMTPGKYNVAHTRNFYKVIMEKIPKSLIETVSINAVKCASALSPGFPLYFASDSSHASETVRAYANKYNYTIFTAQDDGVMQDNGVNINTNRTNKEPLHLDFAGRGNKTYPVHEFYDSFVDIFLLGNSKCVTFHRGGFGKYASMLSFDSACNFRVHQRIPGKRIPGKKQWQMVPCDEFVDNNPERI